MKKQIILVFAMFMFITTSLFPENYNLCNKDTQGNNLYYESFKVPGSADLLIGTFGGMVKSTNNGKDWDLLEGKIGDYFIKGIAIKDKNIFAAVYHFGVVMSSDKGSTWKDKNNGLTNFKTTCIITNANDIYIGTNGGGVFKSTNNGETWINISMDLKGKDIACIAISGNSLFVGTYANGAFMTSNQGNSWQEINNGLNFKWVSSIVVLNNIIFAGTRDKSAGGIFYSTNNGKNWSATTSDMAKAPICAMFKIDDMVVAGIDTDKLIYSEDKGKTWLLNEDKLRIRKIILQAQNKGFLMQAYARKINVTFILPGK